MKRQIVAIHGGDSYETYEEYIVHLKNRTLKMDDLKRKIWRETLGDSLGSDYEVLLPRMPNKENARYSEWKIQFDKIIPLLENEVVLLGHSMGGIFLAKYLAENQCSKAILASFLVAAPFDTAEADYSLGDFELPDDLNNFVKQGGLIKLYASKDDPVVPFADIEKYKKALPSATVKVFEDRGHFTQPAFPELVEDIKNVWK
jgi:uncharacterized protein